MTSPTVQSGSAGSDPLGLNTGAGNPYGLSSAPPPTPSLNWDWTSPVPTF